MYNAKGLLAPLLFYQIYKQSIRFNRFLPYFCQPFQLHNCSLLVYKISKSDEDISLYQPGA